MKDSHLTSVRSWEGQQRNNCSRRGSKQKAGGAARKGQEGQQRNVRRGRKQKAGGAASKRQEGQQVKGRRGSKGMSGGAASKRQEGQ